jgi:hypothetical protein
MGKRLGAAIAGAALMVSAVSGTAQAADCWQAHEVSAAKVRDLQTMLMVAALRCRTSNDRILAAYNRFMTEDMALVTTANTRLKKHFMGAYGQIEGQREYDRFTTVLANNYGSDGASAESCADFTDLADSAAQIGREEGLLQLAEDRGIEPRLPTRSCPMDFAAK